MEAMATEAVVSRVAHVVVDSMWRQIGYIWNYKDNIQDLKKQLQKLKDQRQSMQHSVDEARRNGEEIEDTVTNWLKSADEAIQVAEEIFKDNDSANKSCFMGCCPNLKNRYQFSRKAKKEITPGIAAIEGEKNRITKISYRLDVQELGLAKDYEALVSRMESLKEIVGALKNVDVNFIGVYGLGGIGKTTLVKQQVAAQVKEEGIFKTVCIANVTHTWDLNKIQQEIAGWLGLNFNVESTEVRAARLRARLKNEEKVLVILDDIWVRIKLEEIGIPKGDDHKGCKILMTSRNLNVLLQMGVQRHFLLQILGEEEAWQLFEKTTGDHVKNSGLESIAIQVAKRCAGLPLLIVAVATALKNKELFEWNDALEQLEKFDDKGIEAQVYSALELSYKFLGDNEKSLLLLCAQLAPHNISIIHLLKYGIGLSIFSECATVKAARNRLLKLVNDLKNSCLLLEGDNDDDSFKMHDIVHSFAASIASKERGVFTVANCNYVLEDWQEMEAFGQCTAIFLRNCQILKLPQEIECPQLESFILYNKDSSLKIPKNFFGRMKKLKLVDLSDVDLGPVPLSLQFLENLQTLCLGHCDLENIAVIGELKKLKVLSLNGSIIVQLPMEIRNLTRLQLLDLSGCERLEVIPSDVLSCLAKLEELYMGNSFMKWEGEEDYVRGDNASLGELKKLLNLVTLDLHIMDAKIIPEGLFSKKLDRFRIFVGEEWDWSGKYKTMRTLKLKLNTSIELQLQLERVKVVLMRTEDLYLDDMKGVKNMLPELDEGGFVQLKHLQVQNSHEIEYIIDCKRIRNVIAFPSLESLCLENLNKLEKIWNGTLRKGCFSNLRKLKVGNCNLLRNVFSISMVRELSKLEEIDVSSCRSMEEIVGEKCENDETIKLTRLRTLTLEDLPLLVGFCSQRMHKVATTNVAAVFSKKIQFPNLVDLKLSLNNVEKIWDDQLIELCPFEMLTTLMIDGCANLTTVFTSSMVGSLAQLKYLEICNCNCLEQVIITQAEFEEIILPKLESLRMRVLPNLIRFCSGNLIECQSLKWLWIENCPRLQAFVSSSSTVHQGNSTLFDEKVSFPNLEEIYAFYMHKLKMIWNNEVREDSFCKLKFVRVDNCKQLLKVFPSKLLMRFQSVETLILHSCYLLEEVFDVEMLIKLKESHEYDVAVTQLRKLEILELPELKHVWNEDPHGILSFENLSSVDVRFCPSLKSLFPASVARNLIRLEMLFIGHCGLEENIVAKEKEFESNTKFVLPRLRQFTLRNLQQLQSFYNGIHALECPELQVLRIYCCDKVDIFSSTPQDREETCPETQSKIQFQQPFLSLTKAVNLEELTINGSDISKLQHGQFPVPHLYKLRVVHLHFLKDDWTELPFDFLVKFQNLDTLTMRDCDFKELFPYDMVGEVAITLSRIRHLKLEWVPYIRHVWNQESQPHQFLQNLQTLQISICDSLISLAPSSASFQNLSLLDVYLCEGMLNLISSSTALSLVNLTSMSIKECKVMTEIIVANEGDESQFQSDEIIFRKLATLKLDCLKSLICFCLGTCTIKFPSLEEVYVSQCPRLKIFSQGVLSAPKLKRVYVTEEGDKWRWIGDLNTTIKQMYIEMVGFNAIQHLKLSEFPQLKEVWHDQLPFQFFYNLSTLVIDECGSFPISVPSSLLPFLNNLEELEVSNCDSVEQAFGLEWPNGNEHLGLLSNLNNLRLIDLPRLRCVWNEVPNGILDFRNLKMLKFHGCRSLRYIFTPTMSLYLVQLKEVEVKSCFMVEEIITKGVANEAADNIIFPELNSISLESLPSLISFNSGNKTAECPSLRQITVADCPSKFCSTFLRELGANVADGISELKIQFPNLVDLKLSLNNVEKIWDDQLIELCPFEMLTTLMIDGCANLTTVFTSSMVGSLAQLKYLEICNCNCLEQVIITQAEFEEIILPKLESLRMRVLPNLIRFCSGNLIECQSLKWLWIENCPRLQAFVSSSSTVHQGNSTLFDEKVLFPNLEEIYAFYMHKLKMIWNNEVREDSFCKLKFVTVDHCKQLLKVFPSKLLIRFQSVETLILHGCDLLEEVFDLEMLIKLKECHEYDVAVTQLRKLEILELPELKHVWNEDPHGILSFENLRSVDVRFCPSLKSLFSASVARNLIWLETLFIGNCGLEENIVAKEKEFESNPKFVLPRLKQLTLRSLPQLQSFYNGIHALECPELQALRIHGCDKVEIFSSTPQDREETCLETQSKIQFQHPFLSLTKAVNLEELTINGSDISKLQHGQFPVPHLYKLRVVHLHFLKDDWTELPFDFLVKFQNLDTLMMRDCDFKELFPCDMVGEVVSTLSRIRHLKLSFLPYIRHVWNQESQPDQFLQNLQTLQISICDSLISLAPSSASFQNLSVVDVYLCEGMLNLISSSTALSLVNLTSMSIKECEEVTEIIVANEGDEFQFQSGDIIFRKLATLKLDCLKSLICFCSATCTIKFPSLEEVYVSQCPRLEIFSNGVLSVPKLKRVYVTQEGDKWRWIRDLNTTIKQMYIEMVGFNATQHLKLSEFPQLKEVWHDQLPFNFFYNLSTLVIDECGSFPISVPSSLLPVLNNLEELEVRNCNSVEQAFGLEWPNGNEHLGFLSNLNSLRLIDLPRLRCVWHEIPKGTLDLRNLKMLKFHGCSSLRYIFTPTLSLCLVQLKEVVVESCVMVEEIITKGVAKQAADNIIFPVLNSISLESLPSLISFNSGNKTAECPSLKQITVADCPSKFCSTFLRELGANVADGISELKVLFPSLKEVKLLLLDIEKIWHTPQLEMSSVQNLTSLIVDGCGNLKYLSSSTMIKSIVHLKRLEICDCKMLEEVIVLEELEENVMNIKLFLHDLDFLKLQDLPKLTEFCTCNLIECPALKELWIQNCPQLTTFALKFSSANIAATSGLEILNSTLFDEKVMFPNLEEMQMRNMDNLKTIWHKELRSNSFCRIKVLKVEDVKQSVKIFPSSILRSLEELVIKNCESVEEVFDLQELMNMKETVVSQLRLLVIDNLPNLKHVWNEDPLGFVSFHHLSSVYVWNCLNLKILFRASVAKGLSQLEALNIDGCGLEEIVAKEEEDAKATPKFVFPRLKSLYLWGLQQLRCFYPGTHTLECPVLEKLQVYRCPRLEIFTFEPNNLPELHLESQLEKVVINLEHLSLPTKDAIMMSQLPVPGNLFHKLKSVNINCFNDEFAVFPVDLLLKFQNIEKLIVCCCDFKELLLYEGLVDKKKHVSTLAKIQHLELDLLPHVKHIWNQHTQLNQGLPYLESLLVKRCDSLISLAPSPASFKNLTTLDVMKCNGLVSLVTPSTAKSLGQLKKMSIQECNMVKKIIAGEGDESKEEIIFRRLESLQLSSLPNLVSFCWEEHTFRFPCLTQVIMRQCPKMQVFSNGALSTPVIRRVQVTEEESEKGRWNINLNSTIQHMFAEMGN